MKSLIDIINENDATRNGDEVTWTEVQVAVALKQSIADMWTEHLDTKNYVVHMALNKYYNEAGEHVDSIIEAIKSFKPTFTIGGTQSPICYCENVGCPACYLSHVREIMYYGIQTYWNEYREIVSTCDDLDKLISETLYQINVLSKRLDTCPSLSDYVASPCGSPETVAGAELAPALKMAANALGEASKDLYKNIMVALDEIYNNSFKNQAEAKKEFKMFADGKDPESLIVMMIRHLEMSGLYREGELDDEVEEMSDIMKDVIKANYL